MGDLISRAALLEFAHNHIDGQVDCNDIARFPSVDAEPVRHGQNVSPMHFSDEFVCSECGFCCEIIELRYGDDGMGEPHAYEYDCKFCPNCGAKMDGDKDGK